MGLKRRNKLAKRAAENDGLTFRTFEVRASTINIEARTIGAVVSTDSPVLMPDFERMEMVPEVLLTSGAEIPATRQVPLLDSHQRKATDDQLGSVRDLAVGASKIDGVLHFSSAAEKQWTKVREGHITDVSAGYRILKRQFVPKGETRTIDGRSFTGPMNVVSKWRLFEVSVLPIGADQQAKLRGIDPQAFSKRDGDFEMDKVLRDSLVARGMPAELDDTAAYKWLAENSGRVLVELKPTTPATGEKPPVDDANRGEPLTAEALAKLIADGTRKAIEDENARVRAHNTSVAAICELAGLPDLTDHCRTLPDLATVQAHLVAKKAERMALDPIRPNPSIKITGEGRARFYDDIGTALNLRAMSAALDPNSEGGEKVMEKVFPVAGRAKGAAQWKNASIFNLAEESLRIEGIDIRGLTREEVAIAAMFGPEKAGIVGRSGVASAAYNTTGGFTNLTLDAVNKSMMVGYVQAPSTWEGPMRRGESAADFKTIHRVRMGAIPNLPLWPDNSNPQRASFADAQEQYAVESRSLEIGFSYRLLVNDDMSALSRVPAMMGAAGKRTVNAVAWQQVTSNPTMTDGVALFSGVSGARKRSNLTTGVNPPTAANVQTSQNLMMQMRGENTPEGNESDDVLALFPKYIVGPSALYQSIIVLTRSAFDPIANVFQQFNIASQLTAVIEPLLDADSVVKWYLFADPSQIDTVEVTFLQGQETPVVRNFLDERNLAQNFTVLQTFAAKAMNHRGMQQQQGS